MSGILSCLGPNTGILRLFLVSPAPPRAPAPGDGPPSVGRSWEPAVNAPVLTGNKYRSHDE